jgi:hypothetical protein
MNPPKVLYATDEDIAIRAPSDFALLCPREQVLAAGNDGAFGATDRWLLRSNAVSFPALGLAPGQVVQLTGPAAGLLPATDLLVVDQVLPEGLRLRRKGEAAGVGMPPGPAAGSTGVAFLVTTFAPQIEAATEELNRRCGIVPPPDGRPALDPGDLRELCEATVLAVLHARYLDLAQDEAGILAFKARALRAQLDGLLTAFSLHGNDPVADDGCARASFGTRVVR